MNFANAALLIGAVYGITELLKSMLPDSWEKNSRVVAGIAVVVSFAATFLVAATTWAQTQVIGDLSLDRMSVADKVLVSVFVAGAAALTNRGVGAVMNIGQNQLSDVQKTALDAGAERLVAAQESASQGGSHAVASPPAPEPPTYTFAEPEPAPETPTP